MFSRLFRAHGQFCASRPWEVIIGTLMLSVCVMSMGLFANGRKVCGWNMRCAQKQDDTKSSDLIVLTLARCLAVIYLYLQFRKLRRLGSKYLLGISCVLTIAAGFVFSIGIANILGSDLTGLNEALPFFLLLVDLSKACTLARFALSSSSQDEVVDNVGHGMALIGPQLTLDAIVETLVIGVGMLSGVRTLETMCCFGCLSVIANYLSFLVFYPACLALVLELTRASRPLLKVQQLAKLWEEEEDEKPNPVTQRVKVIMCAGLVFVYAQSRLVVTAADGDMVTKVAGLPPDLSQVIVPDIPLWRFYLSQFSSMSIDYILMLTLMLILSLKYIIIDGDEVQQLYDVSCQDSAADLCILDTKDEPLRTPVRNSSLSSQFESQLHHHPHFTVDSVLNHKEELGPMNPQQVSDESSGREVEQTTTEEPVSHSKGPSNSHFIVGDSSDEDEKEMVTIGTQTEEDTREAEKMPQLTRISRPLEECQAILKSEDGARSLTDDEILMLVRSKHIPAYKLESVLADHERGVAIRRRTIAQNLRNTLAIDNLPYTNYNYKYVDGACCENVIGYMPVPVGVAGPLLLNGQKYHVPMATTEGCLIASTNRGCRALSSGAGVRATIIRDGMTRAPLVRFSSAKRASEVKFWLEDKDNFDLVAETFDSTSRFARLKNLVVVQVARSLYVRFVAVTGDAMGMNMLSKGSEKALNMLHEKFFPDMEIVSLSGNFCTDKKPSAVNWIEGRGKSVVAEALVSNDVIRNVLKTSVSALVDLNVNKNLVGSVVAGSIGGFNAHAANVVTAIFIATGQDPAQNVCSSNCLTIMEPAGPDNEDLYISCTMPSVEVGTIGGGTILPPQAACLEMLGVRGSNNERPGLNASTLASIVCATVMAGELSLMSALAAGHLVKSHLKHNRSVLNMAPGSRSDTNLDNKFKENGTCIMTAP